MPQLDDQQLNDIKQFQERVNAFFAAKKNSADDLHIEEWPDAEEENGKDLDADYVGKQIYGMFAHAAKAITLIPEKKFEDWATGERGYRDLRQEFTSDLIRLSTILPAYGYAIDFDVRAGKFALHELDQKSHDVYRHVFKLSRLFYHHVHFNGEEGVEFSDWMFMEEPDEDEKLQWFTKASSLIQQLTDLLTKHHDLLEHIPGFDQKLEEIKSGLCSVRDHVEHENGGVEFDFSALRL